MAGTKKFDQDQVLKAAMETFWRAGYQGASIDILVRETGIGRGSMYNTFGDKHGLFLSALDRYEATIGAARLALLTADGSVRDVLRTFLETLVDGGPKDQNDNILHGCLMVHSAVELCPDDPYVRARVEWNLQKQEQAFRDLLARGRDRGEIPPEKNLDALARFLMVAMRGLLVTARGIGDPAIIKDSIQVILQSLE